MSTVDVGDAVELTFQTTVGATVTVTWIDPAGTTVLDHVVVAETPALSGRYPYTLLPTVAGMWQAIFTASGTAVQVEAYWIRASTITGPPPLAAVGDVATQFGSLTPAQESLVAALLRAASKMVRARIPAVDTMIADGRLDPDLVALAVTNMILRVLRNPGGLRSETVGPFSRTYDTGTAAGQLAFSVEDLLLLTPPVAAAAGAMNVGTIMLRPGLAPPPVGIRRGWGGYDRCW